MGGAEGVGDSHDAVGGAVGRVRSSSCAGRMALSSSNTPRGTLKSNSSSERTTWVARRSSCDCTLASASWTRLWKWEKSGTKGRKAVRGRGQGWILSLSSLASIRLSAEVRGVGGLLAAEGGLGAVSCPAKREASWPRRKGGSGSVRSRSIGSSEAGPCSRWNLLAHCGGGDLALFDPVLDFSNSDLSCLLSEGDP